MQIQLKHIEAAIWGVVGALVTGFVEAVSNALTTGNIDLLDPVARKRLIATAISGGVVSIGLYLKQPAGTVQLKDAVQSDGKSDPTTTTTPTTTPITTTTATK